MFDNRCIILLCNNIQFMDILCIVLNYMSHIQPNQVYRPIGAPQEFPNLLPCPISKHNNLTYHRYNTTGNRRSSRRSNISRNRNSRNSSRNRNSRNSRNSSGRGRNKLEKAKAQAERDRATAEAAAAEAAKLEKEE